MLSDRCLSVCLFVLSVMLVYCGQTVGWIKMKLGMVAGLGLGLGLGHIVLNGDLAQSPERGTAAPSFRPMSIVAKRSPISTTASTRYALYWYRLF